MLSEDIHSQTNYSVIKIRAVRVSVRLFSVFGIATDRCVWSMGVLI